MSVPVFANHPAVFGPLAVDRMPEPLEQDIRSIYERSPLYGRRFPLHNNPLQWSSYRGIPALAKKESVSNTNLATKPVLCNVID